MVSETNAVVHGGDRGRARALHPNAPEPLLDLSTGINPNAYPRPRLIEADWQRLPEPEDAARLAATAAAAYGAPSPAHVVAAPGTQILLALAFGMAHGRAVILGPTYAEYRRTAAVLGLSVVETSRLDDLADADLAVLAHPNNPDGRLFSPQTLLDLADAVTARGGLMVVDEAFMDVGPPGASLAGAVDGRALVVLRSFGKFYGLAGLRLGFAIAAPSRVAALAARLGPWAVAGPALRIGAAGLADAVWAAGMRQTLRHARARLDALLANSGLRVSGGTDLFAFLETPDALALAAHLGQAGIPIRLWAERPDAVRIGLPGGEAEWQRLHAALDGFGRR